nr:hypothetical protein Q903MT_gene5153 [Picea sitchensis]
MRYLQCTCLDKWFHSRLSGNARNRWGVPPVSDRLIRQKGGPTDGRMNA